MMILEAATEFLGRALPDPSLVLLLGPPMALAALLASRFAGWLRLSRGLKTSYTRKVFHFLIFTGAGFIHLEWGLPGVTLFGGIVSLLVLYAVWRGDGYPFYEAMARDSDRPRRSLFILVPLVTTAVGGVASNLLFPQFAFVGYLVCGWGDALGEPVGARWGRHPYPVPSIGGVRAHRTLEGSTAVWLGGSIAAAAGLSATGLPAGVAIAAGLGCGILGAGVEAISNHGLDNLTIQIAASFAAFMILG